MDDEFPQLDEVNIIPNEIVEPESFVALYSSQNSIAVILSLQNIEKVNSEEDLIDIYGHLVQKGLYTYIQVKYSAQLLQLIETCLFL